ncbi:M4 family metallopeptidase [Actinosynnema sp. NPDC023658]|uniref:M4 family metallopeptidase n=1 Tax=Actinosynnema sp. NPDC023658 TaxID=3155465 RepID=UPI0033F4CE34
MIRKKLGTYLAACLTVLSVQVATAPAAPAEPVQPPSPTAPAVRAADQAAASGLDALARGPREQFRRRTVYQGGVPGRKDLFYVSYDRTYEGLPVIGGDAVVATDASGNVLDTVAAPMGGLAVDTTATVTPERAAGVARSRLSVVDKVESTTLSVLAGGHGKLVYETVVSGRKDGVPSRLHVYVNARTGAVEGSVDDVRAGTGTSQWNGPNPLSIDTSNNSTVDDTRPGLRCVDYATSAPFTKPSNSFGNGNATSKETGCADVLWSTQKQWEMMKSWLGRNGVDGNGRGVTVKVGLDAVNAYWTGQQIEIGHNNANQWIASMDVVAHEHGHAIDQYTPGGAGREAGLGEATGDIFGALTEAYANEPSPFDTPDYLVGESINLAGRGPIRNMANPSAVSGHPNCWSSAIPGTEVHAAAGPLNHWFYLLAEGSAASPTCDGSKVTGIGIQAAGRVFYNAMLLKTSGMTHFRYRVATLTAAKNLDPTCRQFTAVKAAWNAISLPAQPGEPTCVNVPADDFTLALDPASGTVEPGGTARSTVRTTTTSGSPQTVALSATGQPSGVSVRFEPASVTSGQTSAMTVTTTSDVAPGTYPITVRGAGSAAHTVTYALTVGGVPPADDFAVALDPTSGTAAPGGAVTSTVGTTTTSGAVQKVALTATGLPAGATAAFEPATVASGESSRLTITTSATTPAGTYGVTVTGAGSTASHSATFTLTVREGSPGGCAGLTAWSATQAYVPNDLVSHNAHKWTSTWYSTGAEPGLPGSWAVWRDEGAC